jgi:hypothetical protein
MTELAAEAFRTVGPGDAIPNDFVVPYYLDDLKLRVSVARVENASMRSTTSAPAPSRPARAPEACSPGRRSCANATAPGSTSPPAP